ncbi:MAG: hypothetical protein AAF990_21485 [Bacteroidota bacterium]
MKNFVLLLLLLPSIESNGQIAFQNASFEGQAQDATVPVGWHPCETGTTPDILPGHWGVYTEPSEGETYMGLITREDGSWESVGQRLSTPLEKNECYKFSLDLAHADTYADYNLPLKLRVWAGSSTCQKMQLLAESEVIRHLDWERYEFNFFVKQHCEYIIFEASFIDGVYVNYKGNILLDNLSVIRKCHRAEHRPSQPANNQVEAKG